MAKKKWIAKAIQKPGALRKTLGAKTTKGPRGGKVEKPIPRAKLEAAASKPGTTGKRARLAITLGKLRKGKK